MRRIFFGLPIEFLFLGICTGFGFLNYSFPVFVLGMFAFAFIQNLSNLRLNLHTVIVLILVVAIYLFYFLFYKIPVMPIEWNFSGIDFYGHSLRFLPSIFTFLIILTFPSRKNREFFLASIGLGMLVFAILMTITTIRHLDPPYYGKTFHFYDRTIGNSPGTTILASMLPIIYFCLFPEAYLTPLKNKKVTLLFILIFSIGMYINYIFSARTFIYLMVLNIVIIFLLRIFFLYRTGKRINVKKITTFFLVLICITLIGLYLLKDSHWVYRMLSQNFNPKIEHFRDYISTVSKGFFVYPKITIHPEATFWFHNVFFDTHRTSGPYTALVLYAYFLYTFFLTLVRGLKGDLISLRYFHLYVNIFLIFITCIPFESSESQLMVIFFGIGALIVSLPRHERFLNESEQ